MKLEKTNETIWSIKRKSENGKFILRSTESGGTLLKVSISLEDEFKNEVTFEMNYAEFQNFFDIVASFKDLIESPEYASKKLTNYNDTMDLQDEISFSETELSNKEMDLNAISKSIEQLETKSEIIQSNGVLNEKHKLDKNVTISSQNVDLLNSEDSNHKITEKKTEIRDQSINSNMEKKKELLKETDWDPW